MNIQNTQVLLKQIFAIVVVVIISLLFYKGFKPAEWLTFLLLIRPVMDIIFYPLYSIGILQLYDGWLMLIIIIAIAIIGANLIAGPNSIDEFMKHQRSRN
ncbi:MAG: hypothetical protein E7211_12800 [Clostridium lundense]|nr:hypothetical protein [Clostridium lundense]